MIGEVYVKFNNTMIQSYAINSTNHTEYRASSLSINDEILVIN